MGYKYKLWPLQLARRAATLAESASEDGQAVFPFFFLRSIAFDLADSLHTAAA